MNASHLLASLNPAQRAAVSSATAQNLVIAGAGSGKTRVLVHRIAWLIETQRVSPWSLLAVTFTNKAAAEMRSRCEGLLGIPARGLWIGTFHGIAHRLLRMHWREAGLPENFQILDSDDQQRLLKRLIVAQGLDDKRWPARNAQWYINSHKDEGRRPGDIETGTDPKDRVWRELYAAYETQCQRSGLLDFAELLLRSHELWLNNEQLLARYQQRFSHLLVDEFQDTNAIQYAWLRVLAGSQSGLFAVGDDDQSIYGWRGARIENMQNFCQDFPGAQTLRLEQNYRSTGNILAAANALIANNPDRLGKTLWTADEDGEPLKVYAAYNEQDEARHVVDCIREWLAGLQRASDCAILYRSNAQSRVFEESLSRHGIAYRVYGGLRFFDRAEIKDALAYLRLLANRDDDVAFERIINTPPRGLGERTLDSVRQRAQSEGLSLWSAARELLADQLLSARASGALSAFMELLQSLQRDMAVLGLSDKLELVVTGSGLRAHYSRDSLVDSEARLENLDELVSVGSRFVLMADEEEAGLDELSAFLARASLESGEEQAETECVQLMTLHSAKGLEFPVVFMVGMEEGLFPGSRSLLEPERLAEERRLAYVGITRARRQLHLSFAESRRIHGQQQIHPPSRFFSELPRELMVEVRPKTQTYRAPPFGRNGSEPPAFALGQGVRHAHFGEGVVIAVSGSGDLHVNFAQRGPVWLKAGFGKLQKL